MSSDSDEFDEDLAAALAMSMDPQAALEGVQAAPPGGDTAPSTAAPAAPPAIPAGESSHLPSGVGKDAAESLYSALESLYSMYDECGELEADGFDEPRVRGGAADAAMAGAYSTLYDTGDDFIYDPAEEDPAPGGTGPAATPAVPRVPHVAREKGAASAGGAGGVVADGSDVNEPFQQLLGRIVVTRRDAHVRSKALEQLSNAFKERHKAHVQTIVEETMAGLSPEQRTIKPADLGGRAGGLKFVHAGVVFKFALDFDGLYGGDEESGKAAKHELRGLGALAACDVPGLNFPLTAVYDYLGYRVIATCVLPIGSDTLRYGSADGGRTVHADEQIGRTLAVAAQRLNLKPHKVGGKTLCMAGDVEGHVGRDGRQFVIDTARLLPPSVPTDVCGVLIPGDPGLPIRVVALNRRHPLQHAASYACDREPGAMLPAGSRFAAKRTCGLKACVLVSRVDDGVSGLPSNPRASALLRVEADDVTDEATALESSEGGLSAADDAIRGDAVLLTLEPRAWHLVYMLRPEAVKANPVPLSPDAMCRWGEDNAVEHNAEVAAASQRVLEVCVPQLAAELARETPPEPGKEADVDIKARLHASGVNLRFLGCVRRALPVDAVRWRQTLLVHMIARAFRAELRSVLRALSGSFAAADGSSATSRRDAVQRVSRVVEAMLNNRLDWQEPQWDAHRTQRLKATILSRFQWPLSAEEWEPRVCLWTSLPLRSRLAAADLAQSLSGVKASYHVVSLADRIAAEQPPLVQTQVLEVTATASTFDLPPLRRVDDRERVAQTHEALSSALASAELLLGSSHDRVAELLQDLAVVVVDDIAKSKEYFARAREIVTTLHGEGSREVASVWYEEARLLMRALRCEDAVRCALEALGPVEAAAALAGPSHTAGTALLSTERTPADQLMPWDVHGLLADAFAAMGRATKAADHVNLALDSAKATCTFDATGNMDMTPTYAEALVRSADVHLSLGRELSAAGRAREALSFLYQQEYGRPDVSALASLVLGRVWQMVGSLSHAIADVFSHLGVFQEAEGNASLPVCVALALCGDLAAKFLSHRDALAYYQQAMELHQQAIGGAASYSLIQAQSGAAAIYLELEDRDRAIAAARDAFAAFARAESTLVAELRVAVMLGRAGRVLRDCDLLDEAHSVAQAMFRIATYTPDGIGPPTAPRELFDVAESLASLTLGDDLSAGTAEQARQALTLASMAQRAVQICIQGEPPIARSASQLLHTLELRATIIPQCVEFGFAEADVVAATHSLRADATVERVVDYLAAEEPERAAMVAAAEERATLKAAHEAQHSEGLVDGLVPGMRGQKDEVGHVGRVNFEWVCRDCGISPICGMASKCLQCDDYVVCRACIKQNTHNKSHTWEAAVESARNAEPAAVGGAPPHPAGGSGSDVAHPSVSEGTAERVVDHESGAVDAELRIAAHPHALVEVSASARQAHCDLCGKPCLTCTLCCLEDDFDCCALCFVSARYGGGRLGAGADGAGGVGGDEESEALAEAMRRSLSLQVRQEPNGHEALNAVLNELYPDQPHSVQFTAKTKFRFGGPDPLDFVSCYKHPGDPSATPPIPPSWHYVSFGFSDMYGDGTTSARWDPSPHTPSGFGFELTMRLLRDPERDATPPMWPTVVMNNLARYIHSSSSELGAGHNIPNTLDQYVKDKSKGPVNVMLLDDPLLGPIQTRFGSIKFLQMVGYTKDEHAIPIQWTSVGLRQLMKLDPRVTAHYITDPARTVSILDSDPVFLKAVEEGSARDGGSMAALTAAITWKAASASDKSEGDTPDAGDEPWSCAACTFLNGFGTACKVCGTPRPRGNVRVLPAVNVVVDNDAVSTVGAVLRSRLLHGKPMWFSNSSRRSHDEARNVVLLSEGCPDYYYRGVPDTVGDAPNVATAETPFVALGGERDLQVFMPRAAAFAIWQALRKAEGPGRDVELPVPRTHSFPDVLPGFTITVEETENVIPGYTRQVRAPKVVGGALYNA